MKNNQPMIAESDFIRVDGHDVELSGETYLEPIQQNDRVSIHSVIKFIDMETGMPWGVGYLMFEDQLNSGNYKDHFKHIKENIENYKKKK